ncbi:hypothetical protein HDU93_009761 [Gonapodya sp. JEL0774]|nr:hypothetical protein HDU93_009761 [Gonapodya sp. JEL0774]
MSDSSHPLQSPAKRQRQHSPESNSLPVPIVQVLLSPAPLSSPLPALPTSKLSDIARARVEADFADEWGHGAASVDAPITLKRFKKDWRHGIGKGTGRTNTDTKPHSRSAAVAASGAPSALLLDTHGNVLESTGQRYYSKYGGAATFVDFVTDADDGHGHGHETDPRGSTSTHTGPPPPNTRLPNAPAPSLLPPSSLAMVASLSSKARQNLAALASIPARSSTSTAPSAPVGLGMLAGYASDGEEDSDSDGGESEGESEDRVESGERGSKRGT